MIETYQKLKIYVLFLGARDVSVACETTCKDTDFLSRTEVVLHFSERLGMSNF